jgi:hypothetical protein
VSNIVIFGQGMAQPPPQKLSVFQFYGAPLASHARFYRENETDHEFLAAVDDMCFPGSDSGPAGSSVSSLHFSIFHSL